jgi:A/G-specific adenine glycosylase
VADATALRVRPAPYRDRIRRWYLRNGRQLPWRGTGDPYRIVVSEVMLQQTQVRRVLVKYPEFLTRFPSFAALAGASQADVVRAWSGLGYNNRAVRLHRLALKVREMPGERLPRTTGELVRLPGIGRYTAHAILCSVFGRRVPVVDINVHRFFSRLFWRMPATDSLRPEEEIWQLAWRILPRQRVYAWSQALMDLGALICTSRAPHCEDCPVGGLCRSRAAMKRGGHRAARKEPSWNGIPDRIHRGKVVEALCSSGGALTADAVRKALAAHGRRPPEGWFVRLLGGLERDGVIRAGTGGAAGRQRVALA